MGGGFPTPILAVTAVPRDHSDLLFAAMGWACSCPSCDLPGGLCSVAHFYGFSVSPAIRTAINQH